MERAIRVHQALLSSPALSPLQRQQMHLELALDYSHSGVLDRGEVLLKELVTDALPSVQQSAGRELVLLYQEEREWEKAVVAVDELCRKADIPDISDWRHLQAHYCCELAERALGGLDWNEPGLLSTGIPSSAATQTVQRLLQEAERHKADHARALLLQCLLALGRSDLASAQKTLSKVTLVSDYSMVLVPLMVSIDGLEDDNLWSRLLGFYRDSHNFAVLPFLADLVCRKEGGERAVAFLTRELHAHDDMEPLAKLLSAMLAKRSSAVDGRTLQYENIRAALKELVPFYFNCHQCGFQGRQFYWCCPSCKAWL